MKATVPEFRIPFRSRSEGFTLIELILALMVLMIVFIGAAKLTQHGIEHVEAARQYQTALQLADGHLSTLLSLENLQPGTQSGRYALEEIYDWTLEVEVANTLQSGPDANFADFAHEALAANLVIRFDHGRREIEFHTLFLQSKDLTAAATNSTSVEQ
ncbi:MAG: prepilin-type N-terminal cleavage/methylation domain-containing protein [Pseudomonadota bacterium]